MHTRVKFIALLLASFFIAACGGGGGGGGGSSPDPAPTGPYDIERAIFGDIGVSRTFSLAGTDNDGDSWTADITRLTPTAQPVDTPCFASELHLDTSVTLTVTTSGGSVTTINDVDNCWTVGTNLLFQFARSLTDGADIAYETLVTGAGIPAQASIGEGGNFASTSVYDETNGTPGLQTASDLFDGSATQSWKLEDNNGKAQLVVTTIKNDSGGTREFTEVVTATIELDGTITGYKDRIEFGPASAFPGLVIDLST